MNGLEKEMIFNILLNHGFDYNLIKNELEIEPTNAMIWQRQYSQTELLKPFEKDILPLNKKLIDNSNVYRVENNFLEIYRVPDFLSFDECDKIIKNNNENSDEDFLKKISEKIDLYTGLDESYKHIIEVKMITGNEKIFKNTSDWSSVIFLENVFENVEIGFPLLEMNFKPIKGEMLIWNNRYPDKELNPYSECLTLSSEKEGKLILVKNYNVQEIRMVQEINLDGI